MVPCLDMANHGSGSLTNALYEIDQETGDVVLLQIPSDSESRHRLEVGGEVLISYGDNKGASEMVYSYGFIENIPEIADNGGAKQLFLDLDIPEDDPLRRIKRAVCNEAPGVRIFQRSLEGDKKAKQQQQQEEKPATANQETSKTEDEEEKKIDWESPFIYWAVVNQEDGLDFTILQEQPDPPTTSQTEEEQPPPSNKTTRTIQPLYQNQPFHPSSLPNLLTTSPQSDLFHLRALTLLLQRVRSQLEMLESSQQPFTEMEVEVAEQMESEQDETVLIRPEVYNTIKQLRGLEMKFLKSVESELDVEVRRLVDGSLVVRRFLEGEGVEDSMMIVDDDDDDDGNGDEKGEEGEDFS